MKKFIVQVIFLMIVIILGILVTFNAEVLSSLPGLSFFGSSSNSTNSNLSTQKLQVGDQIVNAEVAQTSSQRAQGLGGRQSIASDAGMLFVFDSPSKLKFWMKGMKFPLDFVWINNDQIVDLTRNVPAPLPDQTDDSLAIVQPTADANKVLEVDSGFIDKSGLKVGDKVQYLNQ